MNSKDIDEFFRRLAAERPDPRSELQYINPFTLLVAVVLSAQATDAGVNKATRALFAVADTPQKMLALEACTPAEYKRYAHHWLILHGRYVCKARKPECPDCVVAGLCRYGAKTGPAEVIAARSGIGESNTATDPPPRRARVPANQRK